MVQESAEEKDEKKGESTAKRRRIERDETVQPTRQGPQDPGNNPGIPDNPGLVQNNLEAFLNPGNVATRMSSES